MLESLFRAARSFAARRSRLLPTTETTPDQPEYGQRPIPGRLGGCHPVLKERSTPNGSATPHDNFHHIAKKSGRPRPRSSFLNSRFLSEADSGSPAVFVNEDYPGHFEGFLHLAYRLLGDGTPLSFKVHHCRQSEIGQRGQLRLRHVQQRSRPAALRRRHRFQHFMLTSISLQSNQHFMLIR
jgi:hypothetical protein